MKHIIIGYGYTGYFLAKHLLESNESVTAFARSKEASYPLEKLDYQVYDCSKAECIDMNDAYVYYLIPPPPSGQTDTLLQKFLKSQTSRPKRVYYFGSSGVYGDHHGEWVGEQSICQIQFDRQNRRLDAERQWSDYCNNKASTCIKLRISGIYGPERLPIQAVNNQQPVINPAQAPMSNHIYVIDLINIVLQLNKITMPSTTLNIADGIPMPMGSLQQQLSSMMGKPLASELDFEQVWEQSSPMKKEFLSSSKRLSIKLLQTTLKDKLKLTSIQNALKDSLYYRKDQGK